MTVVFFPNVSTQWKYESHRGKSNLCYDLLLTRQAKGLPQEGDVEIMVWVDKTKDFEPLSWAEVGECNGWRVRRAKKDSEDKGWVFAFFPPEGSVKNRPDGTKSLDFDYMEFVRFCGKDLGADLGGSTICGG